MHTLIDAHGTIDDDWVLLDEEIPAVGRNKVIVPVQRWTDERDIWKESEKVLGVLLEPSFDVSLLRPDLNKLSLIAIPFSVFSDGRGFSQARLLRERYGYSGLLRATGDVLRDQLSFLARCGFDQFSVYSEHDIEAVISALAPFTVGYQPDLRQSA
ncbi:MAG: DUF934 domain-containing protein [Pseudomonadota bacterium]